MLTMLFHLRRLSLNPFLEAVGNSRLYSGQTGGRHTTQEDEAQFFRRINVIYTEYSGGPPPPEPPLAPELPQSKSGWRKITLIHLFMKLIAYFSR